MVRRRTGVEYGYNNIRRAGGDIPGLFGVHLCDAPLLPGGILFIVWSYVGVI